MTKCSHCEEERHSRCSFSDCPFDVDDANVTIATPRERLAEVEREREDASAILLKYGFEVHEGEQLSDAIFDMELALEAAEEANKRLREALEAVVEAGHVRRRGMSDRIEDMLFIAGNAIKEGSG